jgi:hypothetical protein
VNAAACDAFTEELVAFLDGEQSGDERARTEAHVGTCLTCRRELDRLRRLRILVGTLPSIEPSADFHAGMWRRLDAAPARAPRRRAIVWSFVPLAAAAAIALVWYSSVERAATTPPTIASAPAPPAPAAVADAPRPAERAADTRVAEAPPKADEPEAREVADVADVNEYPPELIEQPELFLRYPVVRRLRKLENFEQVRQYTEPGGTDATQPLG